MSTHEVVRWSDRMCAHAYAFVRRHVWRGAQVMWCGVTTGQDISTNLGLATVQVLGVFPHDHHVDGNVVEPRGPRQLELLCGADVGVEVEQAPHGLVGRRERLAVDLKVLAWGVQQ